MGLKRLQILFLWAFILSAVANIIAFLFSFLFGLTGLFVSLIPLVFFAGLVGYQVTIAIFPYLDSASKKEGKNLWSFGVFTVMFAGLFTSLLDYFLTGNFNLSLGGILGMAAGGVGGHIASKRLLKK
jgi:hypothetical protein